MSEKWVDNRDGSYAKMIAVIGPAFSTAAKVSDQIVVTTAGNAVQGPDIELLNGVYIKALPGNTVVGYVGNDGAGDVSSTSGFPLSAGEVVIVQCPNLSDLYFNMASGGDGEGFAWIKG